MRSSRLFLMMMIVLFAINTIYGEHWFYFKGGGGIGYDSNVLASSYPYQSAYFNLTMAGQYEYKLDSFSLFAAVNADSDIYDVFLYMNTGLAAGTYFSFNPGNLFKIQGNYSYMMDIKQLIGGMIEYSQDILDFATLKTGYEFSDSIGAPGVPDEQYLSHSVWLGLNFDIGTIGYTEVRVQDLYSSYSLILVSGSELKHNGISGSVLFTLLPDSMFEIGLGGKYAYHNSSTTNLIVFSDTNSISLFNSSSVYTANVDLKVNWTSSFITGLYFQYDWTQLFNQAITESYYTVKLNLEYFISESVKLELPVTYDLKMSSLSGYIDRWKIEGNIYYLF